MSQNIKITYKPLKNYLLIKPLKESEIHKRDLVLAHTEDKKEYIALVVEAGPEATIKKDTLVYAPPYFCDRVNDELELICEDKILATVNISYE